MTAANVLTLFRLVFFAVFIWGTVAGKSGVVLIMYAFAWGLDVVDGWTARHLSQETALGYVLDKAVDRLVLMGGVAALLAEGWAPWYLTLLLAKDFIVLPAAAMRISAGREEIALGLPGKAVSVLQGAGVMWAVLDLPGLAAYTLAVALGGGVVGFAYMWKTLDGQ